MISTLSNLIALLVRNFKTTLALVSTESHNVTKPIKLSLFPFHDSKVSKVLVLHSYTDNTTMFALSLFILGT